MSLVVNSYTQKERCPLSNNNSHTENFLYTERSIGYYHITIVLTMTKQLYYDSNMPGLLGQEKAARIHYHKYLMAALSLA